MAMKKKYIMKKIIYEWKRVNGWSDNIGLRLYCFLGKRFLSVVSPPFCLEASVEEGYKT